MITINKAPGVRVLELGCGETRNPAADVATDIRPLSGVVDFVQDLSDFPWKIGDAEFDCVLASYVMEHLAWRDLPKALMETLRVLKPGGRLVMELPNVEAQLKWCEAHPEGWDGRDAFESFSGVLYGDQTYDANSHKSFLTPKIISGLLKRVGFASVQVHPHGERGTDMVVETKKSDVVSTSFTPPISASGVMLAFGRPTYEEVFCNPTSIPVGDYVREMVVKETGSWLNDMIGSGPHAPPRCGKCKDCKSATPEWCDNWGPIKGDWSYWKWMERQRSSSDTTPDNNTPTENPVSPVDDANPTRPEPAFAPGGFQPGIETTQFRSKERETEHDKIADLPPEQKFDKAYFNGGGKLGGYAREGMWDFPVHEVTTQHVLRRRPQSVLEIGCARGYIIKRLQDAGVPAGGYEVSKHCYMTRVAESIHLQDLCKTPWPAFPSPPKEGHLWDLCFSIATLEHVPEQALPEVIKEMARTCQRGLHGIDFGEHDDGFDKTHVTLRSAQWWKDRFAEHAPGWPVEVVDKEELERGEIPPEILRGDGKIKLNIGSFTTMCHRGWINVDVHPNIMPFAQQYGYNYMVHDVRAGLPWKTGEVDLIACCHMLEHLTYKEGLDFLRECRRVLKPQTGAIRIIVPDMRQLSELYVDSLSTDSDDGGDVEGWSARRMAIAQLGEYGEINDGASSSPTAGGKLWSLLFEGHTAGYDEETLGRQLEAAGFEWDRASFRQVGIDRCQQIIGETLDMLPCLSLYMDAIPQIG